MCSCNRMANFDELQQAVADVASSRATWSLDLPACMWSVSRHAIRATRYAVRGTRVLGSWCTATGWLAKPVGVGSPSFFGMTLDQQATKKRGKPAGNREPTENKAAAVSRLGKQTKLKVAIMFGGLITGLGVLLTLAHVSYQASVQRPADYYTAAVVEFSPTYRYHDSSATLRENTNAYIEYIKEAKKQNVDIVVFPEDGLTSMNVPEKLPLAPWTSVVPSPDDEYVPCTQNDVDVSETLKRLSCAAREHRIYVLINLTEKKFCEPGKKCPNPSGVYYHNTNVALDRTGKIIARYRKVNLYMELRFERPETPDLVTFDTDFGVTFGTFTCFDILFRVPALNLTQIQGVTDVVFPTAWFSELPFLTAPQIQFGWSFSQDANFLVAGYHQPNIGAAGSGIYLGHGGIANLSMSLNPERRMLVSRVPKKIRSGKTEAEKLPHEPREITYRGPVPTFDLNRNAPNTPDWIYMLKDFVMTFKSLPLEDSMADTLCHSDFCCTFDVRTSTRSASNYRAVVFNGVRTFGPEVHAGVRLCGVVQCANDSLASCGYAADSDTTFASLSVTASFGREYPNTLTMPNMLGSTLLPFLDWTYTERPYFERTNVTIALNQPAKNLASFGIYSRDFTRDQLHPI